MFIASLLPASVAAWRPYRPAPVPQARTMRPRIVSAVRDGTSHEIAAVDAAARSALASVSRLAAGRFVELQFACEPYLQALADPSDLQLCLRDLLVAAINRAQSGVLVTGTQRDGGIEIAILDDGCTPDETWSAALAQTATLPAGSQLTAEHRTDCGTTMVLRIPSAMLPGLDAADAAEETF